MWRFENLARQGFERVEGSYDLVVVAASILIASISAFVMLTLVEQLWKKDAEVHRTQLWICLAALVMGLGIWSMHFTGMHAFLLPYEMRMDVALTGLSVIPACMGAFFAVRLYAAQKFDAVSMQLGALYLAIGIGAMHYTGMEAMQYEGLILRYHPMRFVFSIVAAFLFSLMALHTRSLDQSDKDDRVRKLVISSILIGLAVSAMHYIAMFASEFYIDPGFNEVQAQPHGAELFLWTEVIDVALLLGALVFAVLLGSKLDLARRRAKTSEQRENAVISALADALLVLDEEGMVTTYNVSAQRLFGAQHSPLEGKTVDQLMPELGDFSALKDWDHSSLERSASGLTLQFSAYDDKRIHYYEAVFSRLFFDDSLHYVAMIRDISVRMEMEQQLRQAQKLESIGQLAAGIAHEINTPIQYVSDNMSFLRKASGHVLQAMEMYRQIVSSCCDENSKEQVEELEKMLKKAKFDFIREEIPKSIEQSLDGLGRVSTIVRAMKSFSHGSGGEFSQVVLSDALDSTITICRNEWKYDAELEISVQKNLPPVQLIRDEFNQVVLNLVVNAAHAIAERRKVEQIDTLGKIEVTAEQEDDMLCLRVKDNGSGIPDEIKERVFEPFFTTKAVGKGTGQGLNIVYSVIVEKHKGRIDMVSKVGEGTCFIVRVPMQQSLKNDSQNAQVAI